MLCYAFVTRIHPSLKAEAAAVNSKEANDEREKKVYISFDI